MGTNPYVNIKECPGESEGTTSDDIIKEWPWKDEYTVPNVNTQELPWLNQDSTPNGKSQEWPWESQSIIRNVNNNQKWPWESKYIKPNVDTQEWSRKVKDNKHVHLIYRGQVKNTEVARSLIESWKDAHKFDDLAFGNSVYDEVQVKIKEVQKIN